MRFVYIAEGLNFAFGRCVYCNRDEAIADIRKDYANAGDLKVIEAGRIGSCILLLGNNNLIALTAVRLL